LEWAGHVSGRHRLVATQTSSECVFDPSISTCPGDTSPGGGRTVIAAGGKLRVDGTGFGGTDLTDQRVIDNFGTATLSHTGSVAMDNGTRWIDEKGSALLLDGSGGIYQGARAGHAALATVTQDGSVTRSGHGTSIVGVPVTFGAKVKLHVTGGTVAFDARAVPVAKASRGVGYGVGGCQQPKIGLCHDSAATANVPQDAVVVTSTAGPKVSKISAKLVKGPAKIHGKSVIGRTVDVKAPTEKTTHSTHLLFNYDAAMKGIGPKTKPIVFRGKHHVVPGSRPHGEEHLMHLQLEDRPLGRDQGRPDDRDHHDPAESQLVARLAAARRRDQLRSGSTRSDCGGRWTCTGVPCSIGTGGTPPLSCAWTVGPAASRI
jgi:hypothetical protein